jgi:hypothetical protein
MAAPTLSRQAALEAVAAVNAALRNGAPAPGTAGSHTKGANRVAAEALGIDRCTMAGRLETALRAYGWAPDYAGGGTAKPRVKIDAAHAAVADKSQEEPAPTIKARDKIYFEDRIRELERQLKGAHRDDLTNEKVERFIFGLAEADATPPDWVIDRSGADHGEHVPVTIWSDFHWGEVVDADEMNGLNAFNIEIANRRLHTLVERTIRLCRDHVVAPKYPGIVVCLGGDMLSGDIHDELSQTNELAMPPALMDLFNALVWALGEMADAFGRVYVPCVPGNHGRMNRKPQAKRRAFMNFDWLLYQMLRSHFANDTRLVFSVPASGDCHFHVYGRRFFLTHGDAMGVKGGDGIIGALGPILRGTLKTRASEAKAGRDFDVAIIGHWHQYLPLPRVVVNGSLKGYDEYARLFLRADPEPPQQALFFVHPVNGVVSHWPIYADGTKQARAVEWCSIPRAAE